MVRGHQRSSVTATRRRERHIAHFELGVLELERTRREQERQGARRKLDQVEARLRQIDRSIRERRERLDRDQEAALEAATIFRGDQ
jgi:hypothetical protein